MTASGRITNIIFDVDGTLLDSKRDIARAVVHTLAQFGLKDVREEDIYPRIGRPLGVQLLELFPPEIHHRIPEAVQIYVDYYRPRALETTKPFDGVIETLGQLRSEGFGLAVATTKSTMTAERVLQHFNMTAFFDRIQGTDGTPAKPDPHIINLILHEQRWTASETMMVGDTQVDIAAGKAANVLTCGMTYGSLSREEMLNQHPDLVVDSLPELAAMVR